LKNKLTILLLLCSLIIKSPLFSETDNTEIVKEDSTETHASAHEIRHQHMRDSMKNPFGIGLYKPNYLLPVYYSSQTYDDVYKNNTPENQKISHTDFKFQLSFAMPVWEKIFDTNTGLLFAYTQLSYWQLYQNSSFFREVDYEPEMFIYHKFFSWFGSSLGVVHQSNGKGGETERAWNRAYLRMTFSGESWMIHTTVWKPIYRRDELLNKDIYDYKGYGNIILVYKLNSNVLSLQLQNLAESRLKRKSVDLTWSYQLFHNYTLFVQYFHGYGQSLIEYNHKTNSIGIGFCLNDWL